MTRDELEEINGIEPSVWLADGEEREVGSATSKSKYKIKHTFDHFYCSCPAWKNQSGVPVNARTCKHLKSLFGDEYEEARIALKNPDGPPPRVPKPKPKATSSRPKPVSKRKRAENEDDEEEEDKATPQTQGKQIKSARPASKRFKVVPADEDAEMKPPKEENEATPQNKEPGYDELAEINGIKPEVSLRDGEGREVGSATSRSKYKIKRASDHYYCSCPAWKNQPRVPVNARTCKHLKALFGEAYEDARIQLKISDGTPGASNPKLTSKVTPSSKAKPLSKEGKASDVPGGVIGNPEVGKREDEDCDEAQDADEKVDGNRVDAGPEGDELMEVNGIQPNVFMKDGDEHEVSSLTSNSKYKIKRTWDHYYCSCPAWKNQGGAPVNARSCKHLKNFLGEKYENARLLWKNPDGPQPKTKAAAKNTRGKGKAKEGGVNSGEDEDEDGEASSGKSVPALLLANKWDLDDGPDPAGWWISEKLDGVRTYFDGKQMISRLGNPFTPPQWFLDKLPKDVTLDGELFSGRGEFQSTVSIVKTVNSPHWKSITFQVFDIPSRGSEPFEARLAFLKKLFGPGGSYPSERVVVVGHEQARDRQHVLDKLKEVESLGGEGLMLREPRSLYEGHRSSTLLKIKTFYDAEAIVTGYVDGKGKHKGTTGALKCKMASGKTFSVGTGLSDKQRRNPPEIGSIIVYRFQELTKDGVPRFPSFIGIAADKDEPKDAEIPEHRHNKTKSSDP